MRHSRGVEQMERMFFVWKGRRREVRSEMRAKRKVSVGGEEADYR